MINKNTDFFKCKNNFSQYSSVKSECIKGDISLLEKVKITITIPTYNRPDLLKDTLESVFSQRGYSDYCVVVVDNNSQRNDATEQLLEKYKNEKLLYFKNDQNIGMFGNQNRCFEIARSEWVVLLHDDDLLYPYYLKICNYYLNHMPEIDALQSLKAFWHSDTEEFPKNEEENLGSIKRIYDISNYLHFISGAHTGGCFRRKSFIEIGGYNPDYYPTSDFVFSTQFEQNFRLFLLDQKLVIYRISDNASLKAETLDLFLKNDFYLKLALMQKYSIPQFISLPVTSKMMEKQTIYLRQSFNNNYFPIFKEITPIYQKKNTISYFFGRAILFIWVKIVIFLLKKK